MRISKKNLPRQPKKFEDFPMVLTPLLTSELLGVSPNAIYEMLRAGTIPFFKIGTHYKIPKLKVAVMFGLVIDHQNAYFAEKIQ